MSRGTSNPYEPGAGPPGQPGQERLPGSEGYLAEGAEREAVPSAEELREKARRLGKRGPQLAREMRSKVEARAGEGKDAAAEMLHALARAFWAASDTLREDRLPSVADLADTAAEELERLSDQLHGRDTRALLRDAEEFAHRRPAIFVGGSLLAGLAAGRFIRSSSPDGEPREHAGEKGEYAS